MKEGLKRVGYAIGLLPGVLLFLVLLVRLFWLCFNQYIFLTLFIVSSGFAWCLTKHVQNVRRPIVLTSVLFLVSIIASVLYLSTLNCARCITPTSNIMMRMSVVQSVGLEEFNKKGPNQSYYGLCESEAFEELRISIEKSMEQSQQRCYGIILKTIMKHFKSPLELECNVSADQYAVEAYLSERNEYVCVDTLGGPVLTTLSLGEGLQCDR